MANLPERLTFDSSVIVKALAPPRRKKPDNIYEEQVLIHKKALRLFEDVIRRRRHMYIPSFVLVETAAVISRLTNKEEYAERAVEKVRKYSQRVLSDTDILDRSITTAIKTKASGFDNMVIACALESGTPVLTDDSTLHKIAVDNGIESYLLRDV
ncbi:MAG: type II toxin-antitoxin system VapC family toxin [Euryarchaeota archaeon]|nr:type II toxin-antitoxin system VapC family toxin [Euryarchaeota archaeon]